MGHQFNRTHTSGPHTHTLPAYATCIGARRHPPPSPVPHTATPRQHTASRHTTPHTSGPHTRTLPAHTTCIGARRHPPPSPVPHTTMPRQYTPYHTQPSAHGMYHTPLLLLNTHISGGCTYLHLVHSGSALIALPGLLKRKLIIEISARRVYIHAQIRILGKKYLHLSG